MKWFVYDVHAEMQTKLLSVLATLNFVIHFVIMYPDNVYIPQHKKHAHVHCPNYIIRESDTIRSSLEVLLLVTVGMTYNVQASRT